MTAAEKYPNAPVAEPDCPRCGKGSLELMTGNPSRYGGITTYLVCESCGYERQAGHDGIL